MLMLVQRDEGLRSLALCITLAVGSPRMQMARCASRDWRQCCNQVYSRRRQPGCSQREEGKGKESCVHRRGGIQPAGKGQGGAQDFVERFVLDESGAFFLPGLLERVKLAW